MAKTMATYNNVSYRYCNSVVRYAILSIKQSINQLINLFADSKASNKMTMNKNNH